MRTLLTLCQREQPPALCGSFLSVREDSTQDQR